MHRIRVSVVGVMALCVVLLDAVPSLAQSQGIPARIDALQAQLNQALAKIAQLQAALNAEATARRGGGVSQEALDAAIAAEAAARAAADTALQGNVDAEAAARAAADTALQGNVDGEAAVRAAADTALQGNIDSEATARAAFDNTLAPVMALAPYVKVDTGTINDLIGPHVIFTGVNLHIRSGEATGNSYVQNGLGNLVVGYNEPSDSSFPAERGGSHNVVVGPNHRYNFGVGLIVGGASRLGNDGASVSGGFMNTASGLFSSAGAGLRNEASGEFASVAGGADNIATGNTAAVSGGQLNQATADLSAVSGGFNNVASGVFSTVGGGSGLVNAVPFTFVP